MLADGASGSARYQLHHPDMRPFVKSLWSSLPPHELTRAIYPVLESWSSLSEVQHDRLILSREVRPRRGE